MRSCDAGWVHCLPAGGQRGRRLERRKFGAQVLLRLRFQHVARTYQGTRPDQRTCSATRSSRDMCCVSTSSARIVRRRRTSSLRPTRRRRSTAFPGDCEPSVSGQILGTSAPRLVPSGSASICVICGRSILPDPSAFSAGSNAPKAVRSRDGDCPQMTQMDADGRGREIIGDRGRVMAWRTSRIRAVLGAGSRRLTTDCTNITDQDRISGILLSVVSV